MNESCPKINIDDVITVYLIGGDSFKFKVSGISIYQYSSATENIVVYTINGDGMNIVIEEYLASHSFAVSHGTYCRGDARMCVKHGNIAGFNIKIATEGTLSYSNHKLLS